MCIYNSFPFKINAILKVVAIVVDCFANSKRSLWAFNIGPLLGKPFYMALLEVSWVQILLSMVSLLDYY